MAIPAASVADYLAKVPADRKASLEAVRKVILDNLDRTGYEEGIQYGMIGYFVPHRVYPPGYHCDPKQPLPYIALASQKNYMSLYMACMYEACDELGQESPAMQWFRAAWAASGKKLDMGKCCIRFRHSDDLALDVIAQAIRKTPLKVFLAHYLNMLAEQADKKAARKKAAKKAAKKVIKKDGPAGRNAKKIAKKAGPIGRKNAAAKR